MTAAPLAGAGDLIFNEPHVHSTQEAKARIGYLFAYWQTRFPLQTSWQGDTVMIDGSARGVRVQGRLLVTAHSVSGTVNDPGWLVRAYVRGYIRKKLRKYLHPTYLEIEDPSAPTPPSVKPQN